MGPHPTMHDWGHYSYKLEYLAGESPSQIYFDTSILGIHELAFDTPIPRPIPGSNVEQPLLPRPESACPSHSSEDEDYFYTSATLGGVAEVTPCRANIVNFGPAIIGLLFRYTGGQQASVGQIRLDMLEPPMKVNVTRLLRLHFILSSDGCPNVDRISFEPQTQVQDDSFSVPWGGTLEWWFSHRQCRLWHNGRSSRPTTPGKKFQRHLNL